MPPQLHAHLARQDQQQHLDPSSSSSSLSTSTTSASASSKSTGKYTPGEKQALSLKAAHPGTLLMIEVGYKYKFFAEDATAAAAALGIVAHLPTTSVDIMYGGPFMYRLQICRKVYGLVCLTRALVHA